MSDSWGAWVAQLVKHLTFDLSSGFDLRVMSSSPMLGSVLGVEPTKKKKKRMSISFLHTSFLNYWKPFRFY